MGPLRVVHAVIQELQRRLRVMFGIEDDIVTGLDQRQAKQLYSPGHFSIKRMEGYATIYISRDINKECAGLEDEKPNYLMVINNS